MANREIPEPPNSDQRSTVRNLRRISRKICQIVLVFISHSPQQIPILATLPWLKLFIHSIARPRIRIQM